MFTDLDRQELPKLPYAKVIRFIFPPPTEIIRGTFVGVDPGIRKIGISIADPYVVTGYFIQMEQFKDSIVRMNAIDATVKELMKPANGQCFAVIEGASYGDTFGQVALAEARSTIALSLSRLGYSPFIMPPLSIRKDVFGNGTIKAKEVWKELPSDLAASLACAYAAYKLSNPA